MICIYHPCLKTCNKLLGWKLSLCPAALSFSVHLWELSGKDRRTWLHHLILLSGIYRARIEGVFLLGATALWAEESKHYFSGDETCVGHSTKTSLSVKTCKE